MEKEINILELLQKEKLDMDDYEAIGDAYHYGKGVNKDLDKALEYYLKGGGYYNYLKAAFCYFDEIKTKEAILKGIDLLTKMLGMSDSDAPICLELFYRYASLGDYQKAEKCLEVVSLEWWELDEDEQNLILVYFFMNLLGIGVNKDERKAFLILDHLDKDGAGNELVDYYYGILKEIGIGTNQDIKDAIHHYENVTGCGLEERMFFLKMYDSQDDEFTKLILLLDMLSECAFSKFEERYNVVNETRLRDTEAYKQYLDPHFDYSEEDVEE